MTYMSTFLKSISQILWVRHHLRKLPDEEEFTVHHSSSKESPVYFWLLGRLWLETSRYCGTGSCLSNLNCVEIFNGVFLLRAFLARSFGDESRVVVDEVIGW